MASKAWIGMLGMMIAGSAAAQPEMPPVAAAPIGTPYTRYCLRVDPNTGSRMETIQCRTRDDWAAIDVDVDQEWAENGVRLIG